MANQFVVTFDGHVFELPGSCLLLLAQDSRLIHPSFTLLISADPESLLLIHTNNHTIHIHRNGQVCGFLWVSTCLCRSRTNCLCHRWRWTAVNPWHAASTVMMDWLWWEAQTPYRCPVRMEHQFPVMWALKCAASLWMGGYMVRVSSHEVLGSVLLI